MARTIPAGRFADLVRSATRVFITHGYRRTQMADVAQALGVAKGTLYLYVESKAALFWLCARHCDDPDAIPTPDALPVPTPPEGETLRALEGRLAHSTELLRLEEALARPRPTALRAELEAILRELYAAMRRSRHAIRLMDRCGQDHPEIAADAQRGLREPSQRWLTRYLESRVHAGRLRGIDDPFLRARIALETLATWAVHIGGDPRLQDLDPKQVEDEVLAFTLAGLLRPSPLATRPSRRTPGAE